MPADTPKRTVSMRLEPGLVDAIDELAKARKWDRTRWIDKALRRVVEAEQRRAEQR